MRNQTSTRELTKQILTRTLAETASLESRDTQAGLSKLTRETVASKNPMRVQSVHDSSHQARSLFGNDHGSANNLTEFQSIAQVDEQEPIIVYADTDEDQEELKIRATIGNAQPPLEQPGNLRCFPTNLAVRNWKYRSSTKDTLTNCLKAQGASLKSRPGVYNAVRRVAHPQKYVDRSSDSESVASDDPNFRLLMKMREFNKRCKRRKVLWKSQRKGNLKREVSEESLDEKIVDHISEGPANLYDSDGIIDHGPPPVDVVREKVHEEVRPSFHMTSQLVGDASEVMQGEPDAREFPPAVFTCKDCCEIWRDSFDDAHPTWWADTFGCKWSKELLEVFERPSRFVFDANYNQTHPLAVREVLCSDLFDPLQVLAMHHCDIKHVTNAKERRAKYHRNANERYAVIQKLLRKQLKDLQPSSVDQYVMLPSLLVSMHGVVARYQFRKPKSLVLAKGANRLVRKRDWAWPNTGPLQGDATMFLPQIIEKQPKMQQRAVKLQWVAPK